MFALPVNGVNVTRAIQVEKDGRDGLTREGILRC